MIMDDNGWYWMIMDSWWLIPYPRQINVIDNIHMSIINNLCKCDNSWIFLRIYILTSISSVKWWGSGVRLEHFLSPPKNIWNQRFFGSSILQWSHFGCYIYVVLAWTPILQMILDYYLGPYMCWYIEPGSWFYRAPTDRYISKAHITDTIGRSADQCRRWLKRWQVALSKCLRNNSKESKRKQN